MQYGALKKQQSTGTYNLYLETQVQEKDTNPTSLKARSEGRDAKILQTDKNDDQQVYTVEV